MSAAASLARVLDPERRDAHDPLGRILVERQGLAADTLSTALGQVHESGGDLSNVLTRNGWASETDIAAALAIQWGLGAVDLDSDPPDPELVAGAGAHGVMLSHRILPWQRLAGATVWVTDNPEHAIGAMEAAEIDLGENLFVVAPAAQLDRAFQAAFGPVMLREAAEGLRLSESVRGLDRLRFRLAAMGLGVAVLGVVANEVLTVLVLAALFVMNALTAAIRLGALVAGLKLRRLERRNGPTLFERPRMAPTISLMIPLLREARMVPGLVGALSRTRYPREALDVKIVVEEGDAGTREALATADLPAWIDVVVVPDGRPRTKPRALNYALNFCRGEIVGVLDAEDRPAPDQFCRVAGAFAAAGPEIACVQCQLSYYNARQNPITRCFHLEYAIWFEVLLRGFQGLRLPIPLGGTSVYFRRGPLKAVGGWDAHNVTEDADLGMRLYRRGLRVAVLESVTEEEANAFALPWIRQRSRWLKGYLLTWLSHLRDPVRLWRDMGTRGFVGFNVLFLGGAVTYLAMPLFWLSVLGWAVTGKSLWAHSLPGWSLWPLTISLVAGQAVMLGCAALAMWRRRALDLLLWVPLLPFYWTLGALAAWKAIAELFVSPYYWDKTRHGVRVVFTGSQH